MVDVAVVCSQPTVWVGWVCSHTLAPHSQSLGHSDGEGSVYVRKEKDVPSSPSLGTRKAEGSTRCPSVPWDRAECLQERSPAQQRSDKSGTPAARCLPVRENKKQPL